MVTSVILVTCDYSQISYRLVLTFGFASVSLMPVDRNLNRLANSAQLTREREGSEMGDWDYEEEDEIVQRLWDFGGLAPSRSGERVGGWFDGLSGQYAVTVRLSDLRVSVLDERGEPIGGIVPKDERELFGLLDVAIGDGKDAFLERVGAEFEAIGG